jgi:anti-sigma regulatory factor (Ser/Thr protein kinase)
MLQNIIRHAYGKNIMELEVTYQCSQGEDTLYMYMTN